MAADMFRISDEYILWCYSNRNQERKQSLHLNTFTSYKRDRTDARQICVQQTTHNAVFYYVLPLALDKLFIQNVY